MSGEILSLLKKYIGKKVRVETREGNVYNVYKGILKGVDESWHGGIGNLVLEEVYDSSGGHYRKAIIRGSEVCVIILSGK